MQARLLFSAAIAAVLMSGTNLVADQYRSTGSGGVWDSVSSWEYWNGLAWVPPPTPFHYPQTGDKATVRPGDTITLDSDEVIGYLVIEANASVLGFGTVRTENNTLTIDGTASVTRALYIQATPFNEGLLDVGCGVVTSGTVRLTSSAGHTINGELRLSCFQSALDIDTTLSINGSGSIVGQSDWAEIQIAGGSTFTNNTTIEGHLIIKGDGTTPVSTIINNGLVHANAAGTLELASSVTIGAMTTVNLTYEWMASDTSAAVLKFSRTHTTCINRGDFYVSSCATLNFPIKFSTSGTFTCDTSVFGGRVTGTGGLKYGAGCSSTAAGCGVCP